jgi:hypothetical protein
MTGKHRRPVDRDRRPARCQTAECSEPSPPYVGLRKLLELRHHREQVLVPRCPGADVAQHGPRTDQRYRRDLRPGRDQIRFIVQSGGRFRVLRGE